jgi:hypothetical protein
MLNGQICWLAILLRICITFGYNSRESATPPYTQPPTMTMFELLNNPLYIDITCEEVFLGKVLIQMSSFWRWPICRGMFWSLRQPLLIMFVDLYSWHELFIWRVKRCLVLLNIILTFRQEWMTNHKGFTTWISLRVKAQKKGANCAKVKVLSKDYIFHVGVNMVKYANEGYFFFSGKYP